MAKSAELKRLHVTALHNQPLATCKLCASIEAEDAASAALRTGGIDKPDQILMLSYMTLRVALAIEIKTGMKRSHGRPSTVIANEHMGTNIRSKRKVYEAFNAWLVERGAEDRPL